MDISLNIRKEILKSKVEVTVLHLQGWLDAHSEEMLLSSARDAYEQGARFLLIDLAKLDTLTSAGMRAIQKIYKIYTSEDEQYKTACAKLCNAPPQIYHILGMTGFLQNIPNYESQKAAVDSFSE